ncbi:MAG: hypothetical protein KF782_01680 [Labilithrix sp.]|nr:hypothetical protein [Labilithrix sp.]
MARNLLVLAIALAPLAAHVACSAGNGAAVPPELREAGTLEASAGGGDASSDDDDDDEPDPVTDAGKDARVDVEASAPAPVAINEIYVDIDGFGDGAEFVELRAEPGTPVHDLKLRLINAAGTVRYVVSVGDPGDVVGATGFWVVGGNQTFRLGVVDRVDQVIGLNDWGLETSRGAVQLVRGAELLDVVGWSTDPDAGAAPAPASPPTATVEGAVAAVPTIRKTTGQPARSFGRRADAPDTDDNRADFCSMPASPGYAQKPCD